MADYNPDSGKQTVLQVEHENTVDYEKSAAALKADAIEAEIAEHNMTVLQAVRAYPMASFWAFVMSCTIVRSSQLLVFADVTDARVDYGILRRVSYGQLHGFARVQEHLRHC